jgi:hypothetical protein
MHPRFSAPIDVTSLASRAPDLPRIIDEYALDAIAALDASPASFHPEDHRSILEQAPCRCPRSRRRCCAASRSGRRPT